MIRKSLTAFALVCTAVVAVAPTASAKPGGAGCDNRNNNTYEKLLECVTLDGVREHQAAFQAIADANGGTRVSGSSGYDESGQYVAEQMEAAGYDVTIQDFQFPFFEENAPGEFEQTSPGSVVYVNNTDFDVMTYSGSGDVTAAVQAVDLAIGTADWPADPADSSSGCEAEDFAEFVPGSIALTQRGACSFAQKAQNAEDAGAVGVITFNQGNGEDRSGLLLGTLGGPGVTIPAFGTTFALGVELAETENLEMRMFADATSEIRDTFNVVAETPGGNPDNVVMVGAHLDSVPDGPGINDNGSGSAAILETAIKMQKVKTPNKVRFAWWGAEESGLLGSEHYVANLSDEELEDIALYLNFDMVGSPNYIFGVYDGDESGFAAPVDVPEGSVQIEDTFESFYTAMGEPYADSEFSGRSDYEAFILNGIPAGGLFTGAEGIKTDEQADLWGGVAGEQYDQCYHLACDTYANNSDHALDVNSDAVAFATMTYAYSTETVNGVPGQQVPGRFVIPEPAGPSSTVN